MKKIFYSLLFSCFFLGTQAQETVYPAPPETQPILITNATVHVGNGQVIQNASVLITDGKISAVGTNVTAPPGAQTINAQGKHGISETLHKHFETIRTELKNSGAIVEMTESGSPTTEVWNTNGGFDWEGKDPNQAVDFPNNAVTWEYGKTVGWKIKQGRDFSREFAMDSTTFILNEAAVAFIGLKDPVGKIIRWENRPFTVIGVVEDLLVQSPYKPVRPSMK